MTPEPPRIRKAEKVHGKGIVLRNVRLEDAEFILSLRLDAGRSRYVSPVDADVEKQRDWIRRYTSSQGQAYFVICGKNGDSLGTVRAYDAQGDSFSWGSWMTREGVPPSTAIESAVLIYWLATSCWGFRAAHFQVHRANASVVAFHQRFGARRTWESAEEIGFSIDAEAIGTALRRYERYLPDRLVVE